MGMLATMALDLLCHLTFQPSRGVDPDDTTDITNTWWQTVLHELEPEEAAALKRAAHERVEELRRREAKGSLEDHERQMLESLSNYLAGELR